MKRRLFGALALAMFAHAAHAGTGKAAAAKAGSTLSAGIAMQYVDPRMRPQDDFYGYVNGTWVRTVEIPADKSGWGTIWEVSIRVQEQLRVLIEKAAAAHASAGTEAQQVGDLYNGFMDEARIEQLGIAPLNGELARIAALRDKSELPAMFAHLSRMRVEMPYVLRISQDAKDSTRYVAILDQAGLAMPDRDYYLKLDDARLAGARAQYQKYAQALLALSGDAYAAAHAKAVVDLETELARAQWTQVDNRDPARTYNKVELDKLAQLAPGWDWKPYLDAAGLSGKIGYVIVSQPDYLAGMARLAASVPLETWKAYLQLHLVDEYAACLSRGFVEERFAFRSTALNGVKEMTARWKRAVSLIDSTMSDALGKLYVAEYFPPQRKARMEALVNNVLAAFSQSIDALEWMGPETKKEAHAKLATLVTKIGYPNKWKDYSKLVVSKDDLVGSLMRARELEYQRELDRLGKPVDHDKWAMTAYRVNARYDAGLNDMVFPAGILQPPFFDAGADDAVNYGAIGGVIGHEIIHGYDDEGSRFDARGNLRDWWTATDHKKYVDRTSKLVAQYNAFEPLPGYHLNGALTLGENIADNSGLAIAYKAYKLSLKGKKAPVINGLTGEQRFFMGWAQVWRDKAREAAQVANIKVDRHPPGMFRTNGVMMNQPGFYEAFGVKPGDKMYLDPKDRVSIW